MPPRILVAGAPRSGTTWVAELLAAGGPVHSVHEPDNHRLWPRAVVAKRRLGRQPAVAAGSDAPAYHDLWLAAAAGADDRSRPGVYARKAALRLVGPAVVDRLVTGSAGPGDDWAGRVLDAAPRARPASPDLPVVVKSVHANLSLEVAAAHFDHVVLVRRDIRNAVASWLDLGWAVPRYDDDPGVADRVIGPTGLQPPTRGDRVTDTAWAYALLDHQIAAAANVHPAWASIDHEALCVHPVEVLRPVYEQLGLRWSGAVEAALQDGDRDGAGYDTRRRRADQPDRWRHRLDDAQLARIEQVLDSSGVR